VLIDAEPKGKESARRNGIEVLGKVLAPAGAEYSWLGACPLALEAEGAGLHEETR